MRKQRQIRDYMTIAPHSIGLEQTLQVARRRMRELFVRHLPVLHGGALRGVVSERDIALVDALDLDANDVTVDEAMAPEPFIVSGSTPLVRVARSMAAHKYGCAVVMDGPRVQGIFTTTDALTALADALEELGPEQEQLLPSQVRELILSEHAHLRSLLDRSEELALRLVSHGIFGDFEVQLLRHLGHQLYTAICRHMELENRLLAPALAELDAFGRARSERLLAEHAEQKGALEGTLLQLEDVTQPGKIMAETLERLIASVRHDMEVEEQALLSPQLLRDDLVAEDVETG